VSVFLTDDPGIHTLNRNWRNIDKPTDVLSWPLEEGEGGREAFYLGDVAISLDTAWRQAQTRGWEGEEEVALLLVHGILHLLGYEDETEEGAEAMRVVETRILGKPLEKIESTSSASGRIDP
jgi:probable rRNA maturation factor